MGTVKLVTVPILRSLEILAPADRTEYVLTGEPGGDRIRLRASREDEEVLHWYLDERYLGPSVPEHPMRLPLSPGEHTLTCMAGAGDIDSVRFSVVSPDAGVSFKAL